MAKGIGAEKMSAELVEFYKGAFEAFSIDDDDKRISKAEFMDTASRTNAGINVSDEAVEASFAKYDTDDNGLTEEEYLDLVYLANLEDAKILMEAADKNGDKSVDRDELLAVLGEKLGWSEEAVDNVLQQANTDSDKRLSIEELVQFLLQ